MSKEKEFNLLHEPWIRARHPSGETEEVSLLGIFNRAHEFQGLGGELPTQDIAILRLLLAILHAVFGRQDFKGDYAPLLSPSDALGRWQSLWGNAEFPSQVIKKYLLDYEERFWLFHPKYPFYQVPDMDIATEYTAAKLNGELSESGNKVRLFPQRTRNSKANLFYPEAARWLIYINAFDDTSAKPKGKNLPSPGAGWLGKLGLITALGENLFETLLLNLVLLKNGENELWGKEKPLWETSVNSGERIQIVVPDNLSELYTLQSRRLQLLRQNGHVTGYLLLGGDFFMRENSFSEQMTTWRLDNQKKSGPPDYLPRRHSPTRQLWRDFAALVGQSDTQHPPGIVSWLARLKSARMISNPLLRLQTAAVKYGDKDFFVEDVFSDSLSFNANLLTSLGEGWINRIIDILGKTDELVRQVGYLARNLAKASGSTDGNSQGQTARTQTYYRLDTPFRRWLEALNPGESDIEEACEEWWLKVKRIVLSVGNELVGQAGPQAIVGRYVNEKIGGKDVERLYNAPQAHNQFVAKVLTLMG